MIFYFWNLCSILYQQLVSVSVQNAELAAVPLSVVDQSVWVITWLSAALWQSYKCRSQKSERIWDTFCTKVPIKKAYLREVQ